MIRIDFTEPVNDPKWVAWVNNCRTETVRFIEAIKNNSEYEVTNLYKSEYVRKTYYLSDKYCSPFFRKCAYCEDSVASQNGDIDHFRPKNRVSNEKYEPIAGHNGYYWLAYDWHNLLPCCLKCNQKRIWEKQEGNVVVGKQDCFPLEENSPRAYCPEDNLSEEQPLFIHPLLENPEDHLSMELKTGVLKWKTNRGKFCVEIFGLNIRDDLRNGRKNCIEVVTNKFIKYTNFIQEGDLEKAAQSLEEILKIANGEREFSLAARCFLIEMIGDDYRERLNSKLKQIKTQIEAD